MAGVVLGSLISVTTGQAQASTCNKPYCGGVVNNNNNRSNRFPIRVANCWDGDGFRIYRDQLQCVRSPGRPDLPNADFELAPGTTTAVYYNYYDTDAFRAFRGCRTVYQVGSGPYQAEDRHGQSSVWIRIRAAQVNIISIDC